MNTVPCEHRAVAGNTSKQRLLELNAQHLDSSRRTARYRLQWKPLTITTNIPLLVLSSGNTSPPKTLGSTSGCRLGPLT